ncbi:MAG: PaaI family thioesterase [Pseudomonadota bacterium]
MPDAHRITDVFPKPSPSSSTLGFEILALDMTAWTTRVRFDGKPEFRNPAGYIQGGFLAAMLDDTIGFLAGMKTAPKALPSTVDLHTTFLRPVRVGAVEVAARLANIGRAMIFAEATLFDSRGKEAARSSASLTVNPVQKKHPNS